MSSSVHAFIGPPFYPLTTELQGRKLRVVAARNLPTEATKARDESSAVMTVEEAAAALRIGRRLAYELAHRYLDTAGAEGLPVVRLGRLLRVPKAKLDLLLAGDPPPLASSPQLRGIQGGRARRRS